MSKTAHVVDGEASESDSEIEIGKSPTALERGAPKFAGPVAFATLATWLIRHCELEIPTNTAGSVIAGEAPESDDESKITRVQTPSEPDLPLHSVLTPPTSPSKIYNSLLHQKLWECNVSLRASIEGLFRHTTELSVDKLARADKTLLNVQESMRATNANLSLARARLKQMQAELEKANCSAALTTVKIKS